MGIRVECNSTGELDGMAVASLIVVHEVRRIHTRGTLHFFVASIYEVYFYFLFCFRIFRFISWGGFINSLVLEWKMHLKKFQ